jgi:soluble lytic murein transglycosylase-like protein
MAAVWLGLYPAPAMATVLDIDPEGHVTVIEGMVRRPYVPASLQSAKPVKPRAVAHAQGSPQVMSAISSAAQSQNLDAKLIEAVAWQESRLRPDAVSPKGAMGVMQLMPATARDLSVRPNDVTDNVRGGATYLRQLLARYDGDLVKALAAYNAGPGTVDRRGGPPPYKETQAYIAAVLEHMAEQVVPIQTHLSTRPIP